MGSALGMIKTQILDVEKILYSKNPALKKVVPKFIISYLKKIVHQDELNAFLDKWGYLKDAELIEAGLSYFDIKFKVSGIENIPVRGRFIFVSNHPLGGLDGLVFINTLSKKFSEIGECIKKIGISARKICGYNISFVFDCFSYETFMPLKIFNCASYLS